MMGFATCWWVYSTHMKYGVSINGESPIAGWFIMEHPIKMDD
jgi:hypothetical protein